MLYPRHQPIALDSGQKIEEPCRREDVFIDQARNRADVLIVDERGPYDPESQVATDVEVAEPWPFDPAATKWKLKRQIRQKTSEELASETEANKLARVSNLSREDLVTILLAIVNEERQNRTTPVAPLTRAQFITFCRNRLGIT